MNPEALKHAIGAGLLSFPVTPFTPDTRSIDTRAYGDHIAWLGDYRPAALFAAGGTGEFFSLTPSEVVDTVRTAKAAAGDTPIIAGCGYGTALAVELAQAVEAAGADGILLLPHYLVGAEQAGLFAHVKAVCDAIDIGVIVYNRDNAVLETDTLARLCDVCPNLIGFKDGLGDIELLGRVCTTLDERLVYIGGMPTAEVYAKAYQGVGVSTYSSAVFNFIPEQAQRFFQAMRNGDNAVMDTMLREFFFPYLDIRNRRKGYAVSIVKAGMRLIGLDPGPVRSPLTDLDADETRALGRLLTAVGAPVTAA